MASRLPTPGGDNGNWGSVLNDFLLQSHNPDGTLVGGSVTNAQVSSTAAIAKSKLAALNIDDSDVVTISPSKITGTAVVTTDARLSDTRTPTDSSVSTAKLQDNSVTTAKLVTAVQTNLTKASTSVQTVNSKTPTSGDVTLTAADVSAIAVSQKAVANGVATLDGAGVLPVSQLPSSVVTGGGLLMNFEQIGLLATATGQSRVRFPKAVSILNVAATVGTAPTGSSVIVDVNKNGTTVFTTQSNRPAIGISANASSDTIPDVTALAAGDYLSVDIDQVGSIVPAGDLIVTVHYREG